MASKVLDPERPASFTYKPPFIPLRYWMPPLLLTAAVGGILSIILVLLAGWGFVVVFVLPFCIGIFIGYAFRFRTGWLPYAAVACALIACLFLYGAGLAGVFCATMFGIIFLGPIFVGVGAGVGLRAILKKTNFDQRWHLPVLLVAIVLSAGVVERIVQGPRAVETIVTSLTIPTDVGHAWNAMMFYEEVRQPPPWLLRYGLPRPIFTRGSTANVGDQKVCVYTKGHLTKRVTERIENQKLSFDVIEQDHIENHSIDLKSGSFTFIAETPNRTRVELATTYRPKLGPRWVWRPVETWATRSLHRYVLEGMREKAITDGVTP